jgi:DNA-binding MarR family transcriptional regulator
MPAETPPSAPGAPIVKSSTRRSHAAPSKLSMELRLAGQINRLAQVLERPFLREFAGPYRITLTEWRVLVQVIQHPGITAAEINAATGIGVMNISRAVTALRTAKRLTAEHDPGDSRRRLLFGTDAGVEIYEAIAPQAVEDITALMSALSPEELRVFTELVERLHSRSQALGF